MTYRSLPVPLTLDETADVAQRLQEYLQREEYVPPEPGDDDSVAEKTSHLMKGYGKPVTALEVPKAGDLLSIVGQPVASNRIFRLDSAFTPTTPTDSILFVSDGSKLYELSRAGMVGGTHGVPHIIQGDHATALSVRDASATTVLNVNTLTDSVVVTANVASQALRVQRADGKGVFNVGTIGSGGQIDIGSTLTGSVATLITTDAQNAFRMTTPAGNDLLTIDMYDVPRFRTATWNDVDVVFTSSTTVGFPGVAPGGYQFHYNVQGKFAVGMSNAFAIHIDPAGDQVVFGASSTLEPHPFVFEEGAKFNAGFGFKRVTVTDTYNATKGDMNIAWTGSTTPVSKTIYLPVVTTSSDILVPGNRPGDIVMVTDEVGIDVNFAVQIRAASGSGGLIAGGPFVGLADDVGYAFITDGTDWFIWG